MKPDIQPEESGDAIVADLRNAAAKLKACLNGASGPMLEVLRHEMASGDDPRCAKGLRLAERIHSLDMDAEACLASFLYAVSIETPTIDSVCETLNSPVVAKLVQSVQQMDAISRVSTGQASDAPDRSENLRRMLIGMIDDVRVVVVRLAAQLEYLREIKDLDDEFRFEIATETRDLFAPLANRLGIWQLKWELEDLAFRFTEPDRYHDLARRVSERRSDRERYIVEFVAVVQASLKTAGIAADVKGRPKHLYSIWRKMSTKNLEIDRVFDVRAIRVLVKSTLECYAALGVVHEAWSPVAGEFDDYIATPKANGYRSIHTAVVGPQGRIVEVQIRTHEMHLENELGVAAHWRYKEGVSSDQSTDSKVLWLRTLLEWKDDVSTNSDFLDRLEKEVIEQRVYVFTPDGRVIDLPEGATPVDFAYAIHTEVGHSCTGARINGSIVPLHRALKTGEQVEILRGRRGGPSRDWIQSGQYVHSSRARARIQRWFKGQNHDENVAAGRHMLERELTRLGMKHVPYDRLADDKGYRRVDDFLAAIGCGDVRIAHAVSSLRGELSDDRQREPTVDVADHETSRGRRRTHRAPRGLEVLGVGNLLTTMASCCTPVPGDSIGGYISASRGVTVHRLDCSNYLRLQASERERTVLVTWGEAANQTFAVEVRISAFDRPGLLHDVSVTLRDADVNVLALNSKSNKDDNSVIMFVTVEIDEVQSLSRVLALLARVPNVRDARRVTH